MINQHWFRQWLGAVRQQAIPWPNADQDLCCNLASRGHNDITESECSSSWHICRDFRCTQRWKILQCTDRSVLVSYIIIFVLHSLFTNLFNDWKYIYMLIWSAPSGVFMTPTSSALAAPYIVIPKTSSATSDGKLASRYLDFQCIENSFLCHLLCYKITVWPLVLTHRYVTQFINIPPSDYS